MVFLGVILFPYLRKAHGSDLRPKRSTCLLWMNINQASVAQMRLVFIDCDTQLMTEFRGALGNPEHSSSLLQVQAAYSFPLRFFLGDVLRQSGKTLMARYVTENPLQVLLKIYKSLQWEVSSGILRPFHKSRLVPHITDGAASGLILNLENLLELRLALFKYGIYESEVHVMGPFHTYQSTCAAPNGRSRQLGASYE
ncbi:UNVERIFIED_CONTAM: hypothetical protein NCL1_12388 [Trichonephila clavipes]